MTHTQTQGADGAGTFTGRPQPLTILYTNWRGETAVRRILIDAIAYGNEALGLAYGRNEWHPEEQWLLSATDADKGERRTFAMAGIKAWGQAAVDAALASPRADSAERTPGVPSFAAAWDPATAIASGVMRLAWAMSGADSCDVVCDRHSEVQEVAESVLSLRATPAPATPPGVPDSLRALSEAAYDAGFDASGEGWNAEYPGDAAETDAYKVMRRQSLDALIAAQPAGQAKLCSYIECAALGKSSCEDCRGGQAGNLPDPETAQTNLARIGAAMGLQSKPVAWLLEKPDGETHLSECRPRDDWKDGTVTPLYAAPIIQPAGQADDAWADARTVLTEACKPWEHYTGEPPDDGSPLSGVFVAGMVYTERLLAKLLDVTHYEGGDGSEDFDNDATQTLRNILTGAGLWDADENCAVKPAPNSNRTGAELKLVPMQPTEAMLNAPLPEGSSITGARYESRRDLRPLIYAAMIGAAPNSTRTGAAEMERPDGAIHNGREHLRRLGLYGFTANDGHVLDHCEDYIGAQQCFEVMAAALAARPEAPSDAGWRELAASEIDAIAHRWGAEGDADGRAYAKTIAAILRAESPTPPSDPAPSGQAEG